MRLLITGSYGLVGTALTHMCERLGHDVVCFDVVDPSSPGKDVRDPEALAASIGDCDGVVHLAAISRVAWGEISPALCHDVNVLGTSAVINAMMARPSPPWLLFASSREIYGNPARPLVSEEDPVAPVNHYGDSKAKGELLIGQAREQGLQAAVVRLSNVYGGRRDHPDRAVPSLVARADAGLDLMLTGGGSYFDFVHVHDTVTGLMAVMDRLADGDRHLPAIQLTTGERTSLRQVAEMAVDLTGSSSRIIEQSARPFDVAGFCGSPARARALLGWRAETDLRQGMGEVIANLRSEGPLDPISLPDLPPMSAFQSRRDHGAPG